MCSIRRLEDLVIATNRVLGLKLFDRVVIVDPSLRHDKSHTLSIDTLSSRLGTNSIVDILNPSLDPDILSKIAILGKGFGELKLIEYALEHIIDNYGQDNRIFKLTGRYQIFNLPRLVSACDAAYGDSVIQFCFSYSTRHKSACTFFFSFQLTAWKYLSNIADLVDDRIGMTLEHCMYKYVILNYDGYTCKLKPPVVVPGLLSGSTGRKYAIWGSLREWFKGFFVP